MERTHDRPNGSRLVRLTAILLFSALLFGSVVNSASAMKVTINNPGSVSNLTPVTGVVVDPLPPVTPIATGMPEPTDVAVIDIAPTETVEPGPTNVAVVNTTSGENATDSGTANPYNFVYFDLFLCPKGYNAPSDANQALGDCNNRASNVPMDLVDGQGDHPQTATSSVSWVNSRPGPVTIKQTGLALQKAPFLFCRSTNGVFVSEPIVDRSFSTTIVANQELYCAWFITPQLRPIDGVVATFPAEADPGNNTTANPGELLINGASTCPVGFDAASADIYGLAANCHDAGPTADYHVTAGQGTEDSLQTTLASFASVPAGAQTASVTFPAGYGTPRVFCKSQQGGAELEVVVTNNSWPVNILSDQIAYCDVVNMHADASNTAQVISDANVCDAATINGDFSHPNLANNCGTLSDVTITASVNGQQLTTGTTAAGVVFSNGLPAGTVHLEGYSNSIVPNDLVVYCNISGIGNDTQILALYGSIDVNLTGNETMNCSWFFVTDGGPATGGPANGGTGPIAPNANGTVITNCLPATDGNSSDATPASGDSSSQIVSTSQSAGSDAAL